MGQGGFEAAKPAHTMRTDAYRKRIRIYSFWEAPLGGLHGERQQQWGQKATYRERPAPTDAGAGWGRGDLKPQWVRIMIDNVELLIPTYERRKRR